MPPRLSWEKLSEAALTFSVYGCHIKHSMSNIVICNPDRCEMGQLYFLNKKQPPGAARNNLKLVRINILTLFRFFQQFVEATFHVDQLCEPT